MQVAVTGAAGFLGTNLIAELVARGDEVVAIDRVAPPARPGVRWVVADVLDPQSVRAALAGAEVVYHLVAMITLAQRNDLAWRVNTQGVRVVAEAARAAGVRRLVHCGSVHSFVPETPGGRLDETSRRSSDPALPVYDRSKWQGEVELRAVIEAGLDAVICNPTGIFGPIDPRPLSRINAGLCGAARGRVPVMLAGGFDLVDVRDVATGLIAAAEKGRTGENYLLSGHLVPMLTVSRLAAAAAGVRGPRFALPSALVTPLVAAAEPLLGRFGSDTISRATLSALTSAPAVDGAKAGRELGFTARPIERTVEDLVDYFRRQHLL